MELVKALENIGYAVIEVGVEQVVIAGIDAVLPIQEANLLLRGLRMVGKYALASATADKATAVCHRKVEETKEEFSKMVEKLKK